MVNLLVIVLAALLAAACGGRSTPRTPGTQSAPPAPAETSVQGLYESGRYSELISRVSAAAPAAEPQALWLAAHSYLRLGQRDQALRELTELSASGSQAWQATAALATAGINGNADATAQAGQAAASFPTDWFVQYELGLFEARRGNFAAAADAFERSIAAQPRFAYAYYQSGLAYDRINRADLMTARFETFLRLAPEAPERLEVEGILRTIRGR